MSPLALVDHLVEVLLVEVLLLLEAHLLEALTFHFLMRNVVVPIDCQVHLSSESVLHVLMAVHIMGFASVDHLVQIPLSHASLLPTNHELIRVLDQNQPPMPMANQRQVSHSFEESPGP